MEGYQKTREYWDGVFRQVPEYDPHSELPFASIEEGLSWITEAGGRVLDFGCGHGRVPCRCVALGAEHVYGMDLSPEAIRIANQIAEKNDLQEEITLICGSIAELGQFADRELDGVLIFNVLDNLHPKDGKQLVEEVQRILRPEGKLLLKLNDYLAEEQLAEMEELSMVTDGCYQESSGLYLWNLAREDVETMLDPYFIMEKYVDIEFKGYDQVNRFFYLRRRG